VAVCEAAALIDEHGPFSPDIVCASKRFLAFRLPHIGTFSEVARTMWVAGVRGGYGQKTELITFSDDMDGLRRFP
jgi:hypothetical protein